MSSKRLVRSSGPGPIQVSTNCGAGSLTGCQQPVPFFDVCVRHSQGGKPDVFATCHAQCPSHRRAPGPRGDPGPASRTASRSCAGSAGRRHALRRKRRPMARRRPLPSLGRPGHHVAGRRRHLDHAGRRSPPRSLSRLLPSPLSFEERGEGPGERGEVLGVNLKLTFPNANPQPALEPSAPVETKVNYFLGSDPSQWRPEVPVWSNVRYHELYPGVDLVLGDGASGALPWRLEAQPGAESSTVRLRVEGADSLALDGRLLRISHRGRRAGPAAACGRFPVPGGSHDHRRAAVELRSSARRRSLAGRRSTSHSMRRPTTRRS